ncbi:hypothetical protein QWY14_02360 [Planococcus sp. N028]|uniref:Lipoprotein n=1 Tax=Planococcus shixiaomingii TaxID=3058393 RepID=A0ABT8MYE8_9BACL|nr:hypothetical protein [Planococcus sp. N028]MDN7240610.1 hypothetical protein [Planococcus sp. N028]
MATTVTKETVFSMKDFNFASYSIRDADWREQYGIVLFAEAKRDFWIYINGSWLMSPIKYHSPFIRWLDKDRILIVQRRNDMNDDNVYILNSSGTILNSFNAGDAIEGVDVGHEGIWISYYYEGFDGELPNERLVLFDLNGKPIFRYNSDLQDKPTIFEGLALAKGKGSAIWIVPLDKPLMQVNPESKKATVYEEPKALNGGTFAISIRGNFVYFIHEEDGKAFSCEIGHETPQLIGKIEGVSRGLGPRESNHFISFSRKEEEVKLYRIHNDREYFEG